MTKPTTPIASCKSVPDDWDELEEEERDEWLAERDEATVWIDGLDQVQKQRGINFCVDLSATPYFLGRVGQETNKPFPWIVSDFGLIDAIESGLVKIPQLAMRDTTGAEISRLLQHLAVDSGKAYASRTRRQEGSPKAGSHPQVCASPHRDARRSIGRKKREEWEKAGTDPRPPVFILVCKNTKIAKVDLRLAGRGRIADWHSASSKIEGFRNRNGQINTIRVDSKVVHETDTGEAKSDESRWMRFTLDTVGKTYWPARPSRASDLSRRL